MGTKKSDCVAMFPESIEKVQKSMPKSAVSHQLAVMRKMHQVRARREGKNVFYSLDDQHIVDIMEEALIHMTHTDS